jgi:hypothetical protein
MLYYVVGTVIQFSFAYHQYVACRSYLSGSNTSNHPPDRIMYLSDNRNASPYRHEITEILLNVSLNTINQAMANTTSYDHYDSKRTLDQGRSSQ